MVYTEHKGKVNNYKEKIMKERHWSAESTLNTLYIGNELYMGTELWYVNEGSASVCMYTCVCRLHKILRGLNNWAKVFKMSSYK